MTSKRLKASQLFFPPGRHLHDSNDQKDEYYYKSLELRTSEESAYKTAVKDQMEVAHQKYFGSEILARTYYLFHLWVPKDLRNEGRASALLKCVESIAQASSGNVTLDTASTDNVKFYERAGYVLKGWFQWPSHPLGTVSLHQMCKTDVGTFILYQMCKTDV